MIDVFDLMNRGRTHLPFNAAFLRIAATAYPNRTVRFSAHASHVEALSEMGQMPANVTISSAPEAAFEVERRGGTIRNTGALRHLRSAEIAPNVVLMGARSWFLSELRNDKSLIARAAFDIVFHATLAEPARWRSRNPLVRRRDLFGVLGRRFPPRIRFIVLERAIEANLRRIVRPQTRTGVLEHPAERASGWGERGSRGERLQIAFIGAATKPKGFESFLAAAASGHAVADFHCIGRVGDDYDPAHDALFATPPARGKLSQADFDAGVRSADLVCLPLDPVHYGWSASGTLLDCVRFGVPPVTVRTAVACDLEARFGRFGYLVDSDDAMPALIAGLDRGRFEADRPAFLGALGRIAEARSIKALAATFRINDG